MTITIDKAGRVVIPASLRRKAGLKPGTPLLASYENGAVMIARDVAGPKIEKRGKRRVAAPTNNASENVQIAEIIDEERDRWPQ